MTHLERFLSDLAVSHRGKMHLCNLWDTCEEGLVSPSHVKRFLRACVAERKRYPSRSPLDIFEKTCEKKDRSGKLLFLRQSKVATTHLSNGRERWSNVARWDSFIRYHVTDTFKSAPPPGIPVLPDPPAPGAIRRTRKALARVIGHPSWKRTGGTIGKPAHLPSNCWVSDEAVTLRGADDPCADLIRDQRGLEYALVGNPSSPYRTHLVAYIFDRGDVIALAGGEVARPTFADGGNKRFRVHDPGSDGRRLARLGWGATVNLERLAANEDPSMMHGGSERVVPSLPIDSLGSLDVEYLGPLTYLRAQTPFDSDGAFVKVLLRGQTLSKIKKNILTYIA